jgi:hypothetical protein
LRTAPGCEQYFQRESFKYKWPEWFWKWY